MDQRLYRVRHSIKSIECAKQLEFSLLLLVEYIEHHNPQRSFHRWQTQNITMKIFMAYYAGPDLCRADLRGPDPNAGQISEHLIYAGQILEDLVHMQGRYLRT